ncbi:helix-turn-helix domain-containing protein [Actinomycetospora chibensis]|uniref:Helix-turn-helix domain-containing protein n=1 Tax=Actinomycetospora chibensis TaxID=663606 RepID=A0ABV9RET5_9PSEU|nr:helix-turn-helix domain-containing protein [Actinomycetospora chibensis]MDD7926770.1 helix-turn-helix domain-containing protein [Actinomycetospora chibensis]
MLVPERIANTPEITLVLPAGDPESCALVLVDPCAPAAVGRPTGAPDAVHIDLDELGLPLDVVREAARELRSSPLYPLVRDHVVRVQAQARTPAGSAVAADLGRASVRLVRALVLSAAGQARGPDETRTASTADRVDAYVRTHLRDPDLGPAEIAAENGISVRALYRIFEERGVGLEQSIIERRLEGARTDLAAPGRRHHSIATVARTWGFDNPSFFSRRFRAAFGVTPRQWRDGTGAPTPTA